MKKLILNSITFEKLKELILKGYFKKKTILNFFNSHDIYQFVNNKLFYNGAIQPTNFNLIDGFMISSYLSGKRLRGPEFTSKFFEDRELLEGKKHFFIGFEKKDIDLLIQRKPLLNRKNVQQYNPPYIQDITFPEKELKKIIRLVNKNKVDYLWVGIGCPKQTILSNQIYNKVTAKFMFNVGAALDFLIEKKKEAPSFIQKIGLEWLFRLITDFKHSRKKVYRSFLGSLYMMGKIKKKEF